MSFDCDAATSCRHSGGLRTRWICIGVIYRRERWLIGGRLQSARCPYSLTWRGRVDWCQPWQFRDEAALNRAVEHRLKLAGLRLVALASQVRSPAPVYVPLLCEVARLYQAHEGAVRWNRQA